MSNTTQKIRVGFAATLAVALAVIALSYRTTARLIDTNQLVASTSSTLARLDGAITALDNLERSRLAWINAGRTMHNLRVRRFQDLSCRMCHGSATAAVEAERFLHTQFDLIAGLARDIQGLKKLISPGQQTRLRDVEALIQSKQALARQDAESRKNGGIDSPASVILARDVQLTVEIRKIIADMEQVETQLLGRRLEERRSTARRESVAIGLLGFLTILVVVAAYLIIRHDLAQRQTLEEQLRQTTKMEALGRLAGGVAHDLNNLLTPILSYAELLHTELGDDHPAIGHVHEIEKTGETAASVARQLLAVSRKQVLRSQKLNLNNIAANIINLLQRLVGDRHPLQTMLEPTLGWVQADPSQFEQVILNLVVNAREAMPEGGTITIETANVQMNGDRKCWSGDPLRGDYVVLAVSDHGHGMDEWTRSRVFDPFFTTKEHGKGTGLGLATVYGVITQSNGKVCIRSQRGQGTTFEIYLPRVDPPADITPPRAIETGIAKGRLTILLVDDNETVRRLFHNALAGSGYRVLEAGDGEEALLSAQALNYRIDLLVSDVVMPKINGPELRQKLGRLSPGLKTIFMSGHAAVATNLESLLDGVTAFLAKPFTPKDLLAKVDQLFGGAAPARRRVG